ncbi:MAG: hypothetical protein PUC65_12715 [Clostridiales bacterium]|nr:hypothetical protein [Clostridiales bacterium]
MKGILSFVKTNLAKVPSMKLNGIRESQNHYDEDTSTSFKGNLEISDGVIALVAPMGRDNLMESAQEITMEVAGNRKEAKENVQDAFLDLEPVVEPGTFQVSINKKNNNDISVNGAFYDTLVNTSYDVMAKIDSIKGQLGLNNPATELVLGMENEISSVKTYLYKQYYKNIEVLGYTVKASMDYNANELGIESCLIQSEALVKNIETIVPKLSEKETSEWIRTLYPEATKIISSLIIYPDKYGKSLKLAYLSYLYNQNDRSRRQQIITDANTGEIIYEDDMCF